MNRYELGKFLYEQFRKLNGLEGEDGSLPWHELPKSTQGNSGQAGARTQEMWCEMAARVVLASRPKSPPVHPQPTPSEP